MGRVVLNHLIAPRNPRSFWTLRISSLPGPKWKIASNQIFARTDTRKATQVHRAVDPEFFEPELLRGYFGDPPCVVVALFLRKLSCGKERVAKPILSASLPVILLPGRKARYLVRCGPTIQFQKALT